MKVNKIIFDFDGTLADTFDQQVKLIKEIRPETSQEEVNRFREIGATALVKEMKLPLSQLIVMTNKISLRHGEVVKKAKVFTGIKRLIADLRKKKVRVEVLTSNRSKNVKIWLEDKGIVVDKVIGGIGIFGKDKKLKTLKGDFIYVGDEIRDIEACRKVGVKIIAVSWGFNSKKALMKAKPDYLVERVTDLRKLLLRLSQ